MTPDDERHGTYAGWTAHYKDDKNPCPPCLQASRDYQNARKAASRKPPTYCSTCGNRTRRTDKCSYCREGEELDLELKGGRWVQDGYVQRWEASGKPALESTWRQTCECGEVATGQTYCAKCAVVADRRSNREHMRRVRAEKRAA